jgi:pilus assembly protein CpaD
MKQNRKVQYLVLMASVMTLGACEMYAPGNLNETKIQVAEEGISQTMPVSQINNESLSAIAQDFNDRGGSPMSVVVTYDPKSYRNTAMMAGDHASGIARTLRKYGVDNISSSILPVKDQGDEAQVMISYHAVAALAPEGCGDMPGMKGNLLEPDASYKLGCGVDSMIAKQVARPSDLLGRGVSDPTTDGRAAANVIDVYRSGALNKPLKGESASGEAN